MAFVEGDGWMYRQRKADGEGEVDSHQVGMGELFWRWRERVVMKENEGLCHLLCAEREAERTSLAKNSRGDPR